MPPSVLPIPLYTLNYVEVFELMPMWLGFLNSIKVTVIVTLGTLFTSTLAAYAFAKINFRGKRFLFGTFLATLMIPGQVTLIPLYILFSKIRWIDTHLPIMVPIILLNAYGIFMIRQFMQTIPNSYIESAKIDRCSHFGIYFKIMLPLCKPAIITLGLFTFIGNWNNFLGPLIFLNTETKFTIPLLISSFRDIYSVKWGLLMAASTVSIIPISVLYLFFQRFFIEGIALTGIKG
ncbi:MAG: carbohydrate ABC transporter permease [Bacillota bacterium]